MKMTNECLAQIENYQMTQCVIIIIDSLQAIKKSSSGFPAAPILPIAVPRTTLNITTPRTFVVAEFTSLKFHAHNGSEKTKTNMLERM